MGTDQSFHAQIRDRRANVTVVVLAMALVTIVGINLLPFDDGSRESIATIPSASPSVSSSVPPAVPASSLAASATGSPWQVPAATRIPRPARPVDPGRYYMAWNELRVRLTLPEGWSSTGRGTTITNSAAGGTTTITLSANSPRWVADSPALVASDVCPVGSETPYAEVGPTTDDLTTALVEQLGVERTGPVDVLLGGFPAVRFDFTDLRCRNVGGPEGRTIWQNADRSEAFGLLFGGTATIYVVDVNGDRLVISSQQRGAVAADIAEAASIIDSIVVEPAVAQVRWPESDLLIDQHRLAVDGIPLSVGVPSFGWGFRDGVSLNKDERGSQAAEALVYWTRYPDGRLDPCLDVLTPPPSFELPPVADLAAVMGATPGAELLAGPTAVTVGGRPATRVVLQIREDLGCDPGFFFGWEETQGGALWGDTTPEQVNAWIVDDGSASIVIGSVASRDASPELMQEVLDIVDTIRFE